MRQFRLIFSFLLAAVTAFAYAQKVTIDYDHQATFHDYKTYAWTKGTPISNQLWDERIIRGIDQQLATKDLKKIDEGANPDLYVLYHGAVGEEAQLNTMNMGGWGWRWGGGMATTTVDKIPMGQLVIDIGDAKTKKLLWMANSSDTLSDKPDKNQKKLDKALNKIFKDFPPRPSR